MSTFSGNRHPEVAGVPPSRGTLLLGTLAVIVLAAFIFVAVVLPAERGIDPTGLGNVTGLTYMGIFKVEADSQFAAAAAAAAVRLAEDSAAAARSDSLP